MTATVIKPTNATLTRVRLLARVCSGVIAVLMVISALQGLRFFSIPAAILSVLAAWAFAANLRSGISRNQRYIAAACQVLTVLFPIAAIVLGIWIAGFGRSRGDMANLGILLAAVNTIVAGIASTEGIRLARIEP